VWYKCKLISLNQCPCVLETEWHDLVEVVGVVCNEGGFVHVECGHGNLVITEVSIKKTENLVTGCTVDKSVNVG